MNPTSSVSATVRWSSSSGCATSNATRVDEHRCSRADARAQACIDGVAQTADEFVRFLLELQQALRQLRQPRNDQ